MSHFVEKLNNSCTIFTDLGVADLNREVYLVCHIIRSGRMLNDSRKSAVHSYRRPYGCSVLNITDILSAKSENEEEKEFTTKVYTCNESDFSQLHEFIIKKLSNKFNVVSGQQNYGLVLSLRLFNGEISQLQQETPLLFKNLTITHKLGFSDVIMPGDVRNDLYLTLEKGDFEKGGKSTGKNIEATVFLVNAEGLILERCINPGSGHENVSKYHSVVLYHNNTPRWSEMIKLAVPIERFDGAHVRIEYRHCSTRDKDKKLLGFSFILLMDDKGTILKNGSHELYVYKCEDGPKLQDPRVYLSLPSGPKDGGGTTPNSISSNAPVPPSPPPFPNPTTGQFFSRSSRETVHIKTLLCSTKLTQNGDLLSLLKWKAHPERIQDTLHKVMKLNGEETVKFLQDILDALFSMFSTGDGNSTSNSGLVFKVLVHILSLLEDNKFEHFKPVMDAYITGHFAAALVYKGLISCVKHCADLVRDADKQDAIQKCFRSLEYIFKFIIQSRILFARATGDQSEEAFKADLYSLFNSFNRMLAINHDLIILPTQIALVSSFGQIYVQLLSVLPVQEVAKIVKLTIDCLPTEPNVALTQAKLRCIHDTVKSEIFQNIDSRVELFEVFTRHLKKHMLQQQELTTCATILGDMLTYLHHEHSKKQHSSSHAVSREVEILALVLLETLIFCVKDLDRSSSVAGPLVASLVALLRLMEEQHYNHLWEKFGNVRQRRDRRQLKDFLLSVFFVFHDFVKQDVFPTDWVIMKMLTNHVILCALQEFSQPLTVDFLDGLDFDEQLWSSYFSLAVAFLTQPALQLETFSDVKKDKIIEKYGDMRVLMGFQILSMWDKLGDHKIFFIPAMVGPFLEVTLVPEIDLRKATLPIFFDMMDCEQKVRGSFKQVESELIDKLDILVSENKGDEEYRQLFNTMEHLSAVLLEKVRTNDPIWKEHGVAFINSITKLLERLLDYRNVMDGEENRDKRMSCTVNLLNFYKNEINRKEMYVRYIYKLCELHLPAENYTEAAFTLKLHADLLSFSNTTLPGDQRYNQQPEWQRREALYHKIIDYFDKGKCWEEGIPLCKELAELYEKKLLDYAKLSNVLKTQANFFDNILNQIRPEPEYFRVGFYGCGFPLFLRNKVFVYRGLEYERIGAFTQRLQTEFPQAQILMKSTTPDDSILNSDGQYIQICNVKPIPKTRPEFENRDIPEKIISYYLVNDVSSFQFDRPVQKGQIDKDNEFKSLWIERTTLTIASQLPGILRWFEVINWHVVELSPITHACETVEHMNKELRKLIAQYTAEPRRSISPLSMRLQGVIEAAVNGGIAKYQEAFFTLEFSLQNPEETHKIIKLKSLILEKVQILEGGLSLHGRLAPPEVIPLHRRLVDRFSVMKQSIREVDSPSLASRFTINRRGDLPPTPSTEIPDYRKPSIVNTPLPPLPCDSTKKMDPCGSNRSSSSGSSIYGHFFPEGSDEEEIYTHPPDKPQEVPVNIPLSPLSSVLHPPPLPNRPRSVALNSLEPKICNDKSRPQTSPMKDTGEDYSHPRGYPYNRLMSPNIPLKWLNTPDGMGDKSLTSPSNSPKGSERNSWSEQSLLPEEAPPLPPRGNEKRMVTSWTGVPPSEDSKPALPRRLTKKSSMPAMANQSKELQQFTIMTDSPDSQSTPVISTPSPITESALPLLNEPTPPPIPNKKSVVAVGNSNSNPTSLTTSPNQSPVRTPESMIRSQSIPTGVMPLIPQEGGIDLEDELNGDRDESSSV
ncbi:dedicator of cytokinesis protein 3 isoform X2 [Parasteatoda tepidariorum]